MKTNILTLTASLLIASSCGTASQYASSQKFQDGFYSSHQDNKEERLAASAAKTEIDDLVGRTEKSSLFRDSSPKQADTLSIHGTLPVNTAVQTSTTYSLYPEGFTAGYMAGLNASWAYSPWRPWYSWYWDTDPWFLPWSYRDAWYSPWYASFSWGYWGDPWYWGYPGFGWSWCCDPWYYGSPWHFGHAGWIDPGFGPAPYRGNDWWGARSYTEPRMDRATRQDVRRDIDGMGVASGTVRRTQTRSSVSAQPVRSSSISSVRRVSTATSSRVNAGVNAGISSNGSRPVSGTASTSAVRRSASSSYSRPAGSGSSSAYRSSAGSSDYRTSSGSSSYRSSSSSESYRSSSSGSYSTGAATRSSYSTGSAVRSSGFSGGGFSGGASRSSGSSGGSSVRRH